MKTLLILISALPIIGCADNPETPQEDATTETETTTEESTEETETDAEEDATEDTKEETETETVEAETILPDLVVVEYPPAADSAPDNSDPTPDTTTDTETEPEIIPPAKIKYSYKNETGIYFYDGGNWALTDYDLQVNSQSYSKDDELFALDEFGQILSQIYLKFKPDFIGTNSEATLICNHLTPAESYSQGGLNKDHSEVWVLQNSEWTEYQAWHLNQFTCKDFIKTASNDLLLLKSDDTYISFTGNYQNIRSAQENGLLAYDFSVADKIITLKTDENTFSETYATNRIAQSFNWLKSAGKWHSWNAYEFSEELGLIENANALIAWHNRTDYPIDNPEYEYAYIKEVGTGEDVLYFLECNTGWLIEYRISTDQIIADKRMYIGDGLRTSGVEICSQTNILKGGDNVFYRYDGSIYRMDITTGFMAVFLAGDGEMKKY